MKQLVRYAVLAALLCTGLMLVRADDAKDNKVDPGYITRLQKVIIDSQGTQLQMNQLKAQYDQDTLTLQHDNQEYAAIIAEAMKSTGHDPAKFNIDVNKAEFVPVPATK